MVVSWSSTMVEGLLAARAGGERDFMRAWRWAQARAEERGFPRPRDLTPPPDAGDDWLPFSTFFRRACEREWEGRASMDYAAMPNIGRESSVAARTSSSREHARLLA